MVCEIGKEIARYDEMLDETETQTNARPGKRFEPLTCGVTSRGCR